MEIVQHSKFRGSHSKPVFPGRLRDVRRHARSPGALLPTAGFTLVEMLVIVLLVGVIVGGGVASYRRLNETKLVEGAARMAEQGVRVAQKNAASGVKPTGSGWCEDAGDTLDSYSIEFRGPTYAKQEFRISAICSDGSELLLETREIPQGTRFQWNWTVAFDVLTGTKTPSGDTVQQVRNQDNSIRYEIRISDGGSVSTLRV